MRWTLQEIGQVTGGRVVGRDEVVDGFSIDSRDTGAGQIFVAIRAARDGHEWIPAAVAAGATAALVERRTATGDLPLVVVDDTAQALLRLGTAARRRLPGPVIGITGSVGKTSTKDLMAAALGAGLPTVASPRSFNNELGVPLTLVNAPDATQAAVLEMGARGPGHIALLCRVAEPTIGVVTAVAEAHTEMFGDLDGIARAKGELVEAVPAGGLSVLNHDDPRVRAMGVRSAGAVIFYGTTAEADVVAESVTLDGELRPRFRLRSPWGDVDVRLGARGVHQVGNALAALAVAGHAGVDLEAAAGAMESAPLSPWRMEFRRTPSGAAVINDAYNANPASMAAALRSLSSVQAARRMAVLGVMAELGDRRRDEHMAVADLARRLGIEVIAVGTEDYGVAPVAGPDEAVERVGRLGPGDAVLVKGSRVAALEGVATRLAAGD